MSKKTQMKEEDFNILFLDIETVPADFIMQNECTDNTNVELRAIWDEKMEKMQNDCSEQFESIEQEQAYYEEHNKEAGLYAEFGRIACISYGMFYKADGIEKFCVTSAFGPNEKQLLTNFTEMLHKKNRSVRFFCGHNAKEFDIPFIIRRLMIQGIPVPDSLNVIGKKPWETNIIDTMELWKLGAYRYPAKLKLLCAAFGIQSPKDDIDGSEVCNVFYKEKNYDRIATYCQKDVIATAQVWQRIKGYQAIERGNVVELNSEALM